MEGLASGIQLGDENLGQRPAREPDVATIVCGYAGDDRRTGRAGAGQPPSPRLSLSAGPPRALATHCAEEYANLAALLPELYGRFVPAA